MGIQVGLYVAGKRIRSLPDPDGGSFDTAGDFDRLISRADPALALLGTLDPHGETHLGADQMEPLLAEIALLLTRATSGAEHRGLMRLQSMALRCVEERGELSFIGDSESRRTAEEGHADKWNQRTHSRHADLAFEIRSVRPNAGVASGD